MPSNQTVGQILQGIQTGLNIYAQTKQAQPNNHVAITQQLDALVIQLNQLEIGFAALPPAQRLQNADSALQAASQIQAAFNQLTGTGTDAAYLANAKQVTVAVIAHIRQMIQEAQSAVSTTGTGTATGGTVTPVIGANGQIQYVTVPATTGNGLLSNLSNEDLLLIGGAVLLIFLLK